MTRVPQWFSLQDDDVMRDGGLTEGEWIDRLRSAMRAGASVDLTGGTQIDMGALSVRREPPRDAQVPAGAINVVLADGTVDVHKHGLRVRGAFVNGAVELDNVDFDRPIHFEHCHFSSEVRLSGAKIRELHMEGTQVGSLAVDNAEIARDLALYNDFLALNGVHGAGVRVGGSIILSNARLKADKGKALVLDGAHISGHLGAAGATIDGSFAAAGATVGGHVDLSGAAIFNPGGHAVFLDGATVGRGLFGRNGFCSRGEVRAVGATIGGTVDFDGAHLANPREIALNLEAARVQGAFFGRRVLVEGEIRAIASEYDSISLSGAMLVHSDFSVVLDGASVSSDLFLDNVTATGSVRIPSAAVAGQVVLLGARLYGHIVLQSAKIGHLFFSPQVLTGGTDLTRAKVDDLFTPQGAPPPGTLRAAGWAIGDLHGGMRTNWRLARDWLETVPTAAESIQSWHALAAVYDRNGDLAAGRRIRLSAANRVTARAPFLSKVGRNAYLLLVGHGYYPRLAGLWLAVVVLVGIVLAFDYRESVVPADHESATKAALVQAEAENRGATTPITGGSSCSELGDYPCFNAVTFTLATLLPDVATSSGGDWKISSEAIALTIVLAALKLSTWCLSALLLASVTGLLRKS